MDSGFFLVVVGAVSVGAIARWRGWPAPLLITVVALACSFLPFMPDLSIDGHLLLNIVLPPLLYSAALDVSFQSFARSLPQIRRLGVGLVLVTTVVVGLIAWLILPSLTLPGALLLGAIVAPPDAVSAAAIGRKLGLPRRIMTVLSGESLINDATSLTLFRVFAAIVLGAASFNVWEGIWQFAVAVVLGVAVGGVLGMVLHMLRMRMSDPVVIGTFGLLVPFGAYSIAEHVGGSGVLAVVAMGLYVGFNAPNTSYTTRQQEAPLWLSADFLLESFVFAYIGLQFPRVLSDLGDEPVGHILLLSAVVLLVVLLVRPAFVYPAHAWGQFWQRSRIRRWQNAVRTGRVDARAKLASRRGGRERPTPEEVRRRLLEPNLSRNDLAVVSWAGMRGVVTLATALAAADLAGLTTAAGHAVVVVAYVVTIGTLLLQGLTLPALIKRLGVASDDEHEEDARQIAAVKTRSKEAGKAYLREQRSAWVAEHGAEAVPRFDSYAKRLLRVETDTEHDQDGLDGVPTPTFEQLDMLSRGWLAVRRDVLMQERDAGTLSEEVMRELMTAIDAEELALDRHSATRPPDRR